MVDDKTRYTIHIKPTFPHSTKVYLVHKTKLTCLSLSHQYKIPLMNKRSAHKANLSPSTIICCTTYQRAYTRARPLFFVFYLHLFTQQGQKTDEQQLRREGKRRFAFTGEEEKSPSSSPANHKLSID